MVVTLGTLKLHAEEQPAYLVVHFVGGWVGKKERDRSVFVLRAGCGEKVAD